MIALNNKMLAFLFVLFGLIGCAVNQPSAAGYVSAGATANPALVATVQADQYMRDAAATLDARELTQQAVAFEIQSTANAAAATTAVQQTRDTLSIALTADSATIQAQETLAAATIQAQETAVSATSQAIETATEQARRNTIATSTAVAIATQDAFQATRQAFQIQQEQAQARREHLTTVAVTFLLIVAGIVVVALVVLFFWKVIPVLVQRFGLVRYGQHGNPLFITSGREKTVITDPIKAMQTAVTIDIQGNVAMPELTPNQLQMMLASGYFKTLIEQVKHAPDHPPLLPSELTTSSALGAYSRQKTVKHEYRLRRNQERMTADNLANLDTVNPQVLLPSSVSWDRMHIAEKNKLALGVNEQGVVAIDIVRNPHILLAGSSGSGKTRRALRPLIAQALGQGMIVLMLNESGADFSPFYEHPNAVMVRGDMQAYMACLEAANAEIERRERILREQRVSEWQRLPQYLQDSPPILIVVDEVLSLAVLMSPREQKRFWGLLAAYASRARKLAMGSIGALTDPTYKVLGTGLIWREQCNARVSFRVAKSTISRTVLDANGAETLDNGQFLAMLGSSKLVRAVAPNPADEEIGAYLRQHPVTPLQLPSWVDSAEPVKPLELVQTGLEPLEPPTYIEPKPVLKPILPLPKNRPPTQEEATYIRLLAVQGMSKNKIIEQMYGFKNGTTHRWITDALEESDGL